MKINGVEIENTFAEGFLYGGNAFPGYCRQPGDGPGRPEGRQPVSPLR